MQQAVEICWPNLFWRISLIPTDGRWRKQIFFWFSTFGLMVLNLSQYWHLYIVLLQCLFRTPLNNYDAVVLLHRDKLPHPNHLLFPSETNLGSLLTLFFCSPHFSLLLMNGMRMVLICISGPCVKPSPICKSVYIVCSTSNLLQLFIVYF